MKHIVMLLVFAMFITGCAGNEKQNTNENTNLKFDDPWMQRLWNKSKEVTEAYREVDRAKKNVVRLEDKVLLTDYRNVGIVKRDLDQAKQNLASAESEADKRRKEFDKISDEHKEEIRRRQNNIFNPNQEHPNK